MNDQNYLTFLRWVNVSVWVFWMLFSCIRAAHGGYGHLTSTALFGWVMVTFVGPLYFIFRWNENVFSERWTFLGGSSAAYMGMYLISIVMGVLLDYLVIFC